MFAISGRNRLKLLTIDQADKKTARIIKTLYINGRARTKIFTNRYLQINFSKHDTMVIVRN